MKSVTTNAKGNEKTKIIPGPSKAGPLVVAASIMLMTGKRAMVVRSDKTKLVMVES